LNMLNNQVKEITKTTGKHHFFGYYDICPWDINDEKILAHEVDFIDRMPTEEPAGIGYFTKNNEFIKLAETTSWNFQQGARLQWLPNNPDVIIYNDYIDYNYDYIDEENGRASSIENSDFGSIALNIKTNEKRFFDLPIYKIHPSGKFALSLPFPRLNDEGGYGYHGIIDRYKEIASPEKVGISRLNLEKKEESELIISIAKVVNFKKNEAINSSHHVTMATFNPRGDRFAFLHRFKLPDGGIHTRLLTANPDGTDLFLLAEGNLSHFDWFSDDEIFIWGRRKSVLTDLRKNNFFKFPLLKPLLNFVRKKERGFLRHRIIGDQLLLLKDKKGYIGSIGVGSITEDGHFTRYKNTDWILGDNYPDKDHFRDLFLFNLKTKKKITLGNFYSLVEGVPSSWDLSGMRSDLHPRFSRDGTKVCFDSVHTGKKQVHVLDIHDILKEYGKN